ncbi:hypothetical protein KQ304_06405 [Synechococcus sp. CS-1329]|jgi:hypothetical protein|uniref:type IV pilus modification PilV family protein n=1 Tax=Synechococcus sp. CS-1329 TaxID=2847975 RepID=UPI00223B9D57|nr:hypothetical protein [Synechococcus sp. CS-1329]MCT0218634.1 hypothetical protein [Synechococcus sp. CS-1329]
MTLAEVLMSTLVFALAANSSAQLWGSALSWNQRAEQRQEALHRIDLELLQRERALRLAAAAQVKAAGDAGAEVPMSCDEALAWMDEQLAIARSPLPQEVSLATALPPAPALEAVSEAASAEDPPALWLTASGEGIERRRLFAPAAHGLCRP